MISETSKCRKRLARFCVGNGIDVGYGGDPIVPAAITIDLPNPYTRLGDHPLNLGGDARDLHWFKDGVLDYVFSSHLLEDFKEAETPKVLLEWFRVLKTRGYLVLYCPDEPVYRAHCEKTSQSYNRAHKISRFGLDYVKEVLERVLPGHYKVIHENPLIDDYSFELVIRKLRNYSSGNEPFEIGRLLKVLVDKLRS